MPKENDWQNAPLSQLVDHIVSTHHAYLARQLPLLSQLLTAHTRHYWLKHPEFLKAHTLFHQMKTALEQHLIKEETAGFPLIHAHEKDPSKSLAPFANNIHSHLAEHAGASNTIKEIHKTLWSFQLPGDIGSEVAYTLKQLGELESDLKEHIHLEDDILFPRVQQAVQ